MKKFIASIVSLLLILSPWVSANITEEQEIIADYVFSTEGIVGMKAEVIEGPDGEIQYLVMVWLRRGAEDNGINLMELALEIPSSTFEIVWGVEEGVIVGGFWGSAVAEIDYNPTTGFLTVDLGVDRATVQGEPVEELLWILLRVKDTNTEPSRNLVLQGVEEGRTPNLQLMSSAEPGTNFFTGSIGLVMEGLAVVEAPAEEPTPVVEPTPEPVIPDVVTPVEEPTPEVTPEEIETGTREILLFSILLLLTLASVVYTRKKA